MFSALAKETELFVRPMHSGIDMAYARKDLSFPSRVFGVASLQGQKVVCGSRVLHAKDGLELKAVSTSALEVNTPLFCDSGRSRVYIFIMLLTLLSETYSPTHLLFHSIYDFSLMGKIKVWIELFY